MTTESEQLKKSADKNDANLRWREVNAYLDSLFARANRIIQSGRKDFYFVVPAILFNFVTVFFHNVVLSLIGTMAMWFCIGMMASSYLALIKVEHEIRGALKMMKLLGFSDFDWDDASAKRKKRGWNEFTEMVRGWFKQKEKAQAGAYAPA